MRIARPRHRPVRGADVSVAARFAARSGRADHAPDAAGKRTGESAAQSDARSGRSRGLAVHAPASINSEEGQRADRADSRRNCSSFAIMGRFCRQTCWRSRRWAESICTPRCCPSIAAPRRFNGALLNGESETGVSRDSHDTAAGRRADPGGPLNAASAQKKHILSWSSDWPLSASSRCMKRSSCSQSGTAKASLARRKTRPSDEGAAAEKGATEPMDWSRTAEQIRNQVRALKPWPGTYTFWRRPGQEPLRIVIDRREHDRAGRSRRPRGELDESREAAAATHHHYVPGEVVVADKHQLIVATGEGGLGISAVAPAGKRHMTVDEFLRGYQLRDGDVLGAA